MKLLRTTSIPIRWPAAGEYEGLLRSSIVLKNQGYAIFEGNELRSSRQWGKNTGLTAAKQRVLNFDFERLLTFFQRAKARESPSLPWDEPYEMMLRSVGYVLMETDLGLGRRKYRNVFEREFSPIEGVITTNYDLVVEQLLGVGSFNYGLNRNDFQIVRKLSYEALAVDSPTWRFFGTRADSSTDFQGSIPVLKIHGSVNMAFCAQCREVLVFPVLGGVPSKLMRSLRVHEGFYQKDLPNRLAWSAWVTPTGRRFVSHVGIRANGFERAKAHRLVPLCVPPVEQKQGTPEWKLLESVRRTARRLVDRGERMVIIGSSLRSTDLDLIELVQRAASKPVYYIGNGETFGRLQKMVPKARHLRSRL